MKVAPLSSIPSAALVPALAPVRPVARVQGGELLREMQRAVQADGVEAALPVEAPAGATEARGPARPQLPTPDLPVTQAQALATTMRAAIARQSGLAPLLADLNQALQAQVLSPPARNAALQLMAQLVPLNPKVAADDIKKALANSGLFLEANLAAHPEDSPVGQDLKAALLVLRQALGPPPNKRAPGAAPRPPYSGAPTSAQRAALPNLPLGEGAGAVGQTLAAETQGALSHLDLLQMASLPDPQRPQEPTRWMFEAPLQTQQGPSVAQFEISRDGGGGNGHAGPQGEPIWRARFSVDFEPVGPIDAQVNFEGDVARVTLWAAREDSARRLRIAQPLLAQTLAGANLQLEMAVHSGPPPAPAVPAGRLIDQSA